MPIPIKEKCNRCQEIVSVDVKLKFFTTKILNDIANDNPSIPKWAFQIQAYCPLCNNWIKHLPHTQENVEALNGMKLTNSQQTIV